MILGIDPGNEISAWVVYDKGAVVRCGRGENKRGLLDMIYDNEFEDCNKFAIEMIASYGMAVGKTVFETCLWTGRFIEAWHIHRAADARLIYRKDVKMHLCGSMKAKDANIRQAIMDRYGSTRASAIGTKKSPKMLYGVSKDIWSALGIAITADETKG